MVCHIRKPECTTKLEVFPGFDLLVKMIFHQTRLAGVFEIQLEPRSDERGFFARSWCQKEFEAHGLNPRLVQCNVSFNAKKGTLRGMHYQAAPCREAKIVRCTQGSIYDVVLDLRLQSPTLGQWVSAVLTAENRHMLYIPEGCAHGFLTLEDKTEVFYQMSEFYCAESAHGVRWDDPAFQISWPHPVEVISERDKSYPNFETAQCIS
jgi:dTDP-4-dehydrorhamnose 3,5-epimerase